MGADTFMPVAKRLFVPLMILLSVLIAAYGPMASYSQAQSASDAALDKFKQKAIAEIDKRIARYQKTLTKLNVDVHIDSDSANANASNGQDSASASADKSEAKVSLNDNTFTVGSSGIKGTIKLATNTQDKVKEFLQKMITQLEGMKTKITNAKTLSEVRALTRNVNAQYKIGQLTQVQATVTQSVESMTGVLDKLKTSYNNLQSRVLKMKECLTSRDTTVQAGASNDGATVSCNDFNLSNSAVADDAQSQLDGISTTITTMGSMIASCVTLLSSLVTQFGGLTNGLGSAGSLGNLGNLSNMLSDSQLSTLTGSADGATGLMKSFSAIASQLDISSFISGSNFSSLSSLSGLVAV